MVSARYTSPFVLSYTHVVPTVIPGGTLADSTLLSGVVFHKNVSHKSMTREILCPTIMLLANGIEYTRTENRILSLDKLMEQENRYFEILVTKIVKMKPDILMVGRSVSRKAQELLMEANIVLIQHVKTSLMERIARQTGCTILNNTEHVMNQFDTSVLGTFDISSDIPTSSITSIVQNHMYSHYSLLQDNVDVSA